ncbi:hypothetical protein LCGC14_1924320 [marine sediment metagenome]|uniref:Uncharacterized protein n=1 Tax=marine sediment metagenome TaxID=412755 RepID=A0A0F9I3R1_9ZZZZ
MKYRIIQYSDGYEYESFLDNKVPEEYKDIIVDKLPPEIIAAEKESRRKENVRTQIKEKLIDNLLSGTKPWAEVQVEAKTIDDANKI